MLLHLCNKRVNGRSLNYINQILTIEHAGNVTGFEVYIGKNTDLSADNFCADDPGISTDNTVKLFCGKKMEAKYLTVLVPGESKRLGICELYVSGGNRNR